MYISCLYELGIRQRLFEAVVSNVLQLHIIRSKKKILLCDVEKRTTLFSKENSIFFALGLLTGMNRFAIAHDQDLEVLNHKALMRT